jgi:hypothetical protein
LPPRNRESVPGEREFSRGNREKIEKHDGQHLEFRVLIFYGKFIDILKHKLRKKIKKARCTNFVDF